MKKIVLHHNYQLGVAWDSSPDRNHGKCWKTTPSENGLYFDGAHSAISVKPSDSLRDILSASISCRFCLHHRPQRRSNLFEAHLLMACFITPQLEIVVNIYNGRNWFGLISPKETIQINQEHSVYIEYDGMSSMTLMLDHRIVARRDDLQGALGSIGPAGLWLGRWPDGDNYFFQGTISNFILEKEDRDLAYHTLFSPCCEKKKENIEKAKGFIERGLTSEVWQQYLDEFRELNAKARRSTIQKNHEENTKRDAALTHLVEAMIDKDEKRMEAIVETLLKDNQILDKKKQEELYDEALSFLKKMPFSMEEILSFYQQDCRISGLAQAILNLIPNKPYKVDDLADLSKELFRD